MTDIFAEMFRLWEIIKSFLAILSLIGISIVAVVAAAYSFFKYLGAKWIDQKFAEQLEAYKSEQSRELERLRHRINGVFDRTKRLHDREFELLPDIWAKLVDARGWAGGYIAVFQQYADVARLNEADLHEFLATTTFSEGQKREIKAASDKQKAYIAVLGRELITVKASIAAAGTRM